MSVSLNADIGLAAWLAIDAFIDSRNAVKATLSTRGAVKRR